MSNDDKRPPREWWIAGQPSGKNISGRVDLFTATQMQPENPGWVHVVEMSALTAALKERDEWYEKFAKLEIKRASCCEQMEKERDELRTEKIGHLALIDELDKTNLELRAEVLLDIKREAKLTAAIKERDEALRNEQMSANAYSELRAEVQYHKSKDAEWDLGDKLTAAEAEIASLKIENGSLYKQLIDSHAELTRLKAYHSVRNASEIGHSTRILTERSTFALEKQLAERDVETELLRAQLGIALREQNASNEMRNKSLAEIARLKEIISYLPKVPTEPYEKGLAKAITERDAEIARLTILFEQSVGLLKTRDAEILERDDMLAERDAEIAKNRKRIVEVNGFLHDANNLLARLEKVLENAEDVLRIIYHTTEAETSERAHSCSKRITEALTDLAKWKAGDV